MRNVLQTPCAWLVAAVVALRLAGVIGTPAAAILLAVAALQFGYYRYRAGRFASPGEAYAAAGTAIRLQEALQGIAHADDARAAALKFLCSEFGFRRGAIYVLERVGRHDLLLPVVAEGVELSVLLSHVYEMDRGKGVLPRAVLDRAITVVRNAPDDWRCDQHLVAAIGLRSFVVAPMISVDRAIGGLLLDAGDGLPAVERRLPALEQAVRAASVALENVALYERVQQLAIMDGLTEVYNHRHFQETLRHELQRADRYPQPIMRCSVILLDVDLFKRVNDDYGHPAGDAVLVQIAQILKRMVRKVDTVARYGGEEFVIVLPSTHKDGALILAHRLREAIEAEPFEYETGKPPIRITASLGVATYADDGTSPKDIVAAADAGLYNAKHDGRNCVRSVRAPGVAGASASA